MFFEEFIQILGVPQIIYIIFYYEAMSFNRIQKYRSQKALDAHHQIKQTIKMSPTIPQSKNKKLQTHNYKRDDYEAGNKSSSTVESSNSYTKAKGITLRDYLYLTSASAKKETSPIRRTYKSSLDLRQRQQDKKQITLQRSKSAIRKDKYSASNQEIFTIVTKDIGKDLTQIGDYVKKITNKFNEKVKFRTLNHQQMLKVYNFRKRVRENVLMELKSLDHLLESIHPPQNLQLDNKKMPIIFQEEQQRKYEPLIEIETDYRFVQNEDLQQFIKKTYSLKL